MGRYKKGELLQEQQFYKLSELTVLLNTERSHATSCYHPSLQPSPNGCDVQAFMAQRLVAVLLNSPILLSFDS